MMLDTNLKMPERSAPLTRPTGSTALLVQNLTLAEVKAISFVDGCVPCLSKDLSNALMSYICSASWFVVCVQIPFTYLTDPYVFVDLILDMLEYLRINDPNATKRSLTHWTVLGRKGCWLWFVSKVSRVHLRVQLWCHVVIRYSTQMNQGLGRCYLPPSIIFETIKKQDEIFFKKGS